MSIKNLAKYCGVSVAALVAGLLTGCEQQSASDTTVEELSQKPSQKPNVIVIVADDAGYVDFGFMGSPDLETPHLDRLASLGTVFTDAHVSASVCAPSRAGLMTGRYQQRSGFEANGTGNGMGVDPNERTMGEAMKQQGYTTIAMGKWHLGEGEKYHPNQRGFDEFYGFLTGSRSYFPMENPSVDKMLQHNGERVIFDGYMTDVLGEQSVKYVEENRDKPFFMYLAYNAVHTPMHAKEEHLQKYADHPRKELAAMTWSMDENIGKLMTKLEQENLMENTLIFFVSDNGGAYTNQSSMGPLKGNKGNKYEGGHRVPFVVYWQGRKVSQFAGLTSSLDIFPTALHAAGADAKEMENLDGVSLLPFLSGEKTGDPHDMLFWRKLKLAGSRVGDYKLVRLDGYGYRFYNLENDLGESVDLQETEREKFLESKQLLEAWEQGLVDPLWREKGWEEVTYHIQQSLMENKEPQYRNPRQREVFLNNNQ